MNSLRIVFDSNVYIAAASNPGNYSHIWLEEAQRPGSRFQLFVSPEILQEISDKIINKLGHSQKDAEKFIKYISSIAQIVHPEVRIDVVKEDPEDNKIIECALAANAPLIVSNDRHLYQMKQYGQIGIVHSSYLKHLFPSK